MNIDEFFEIEFKRLAISDIKLNFKGNEAKKLIDKVAAISFGEDYSEFRKSIEIFINDPKLYTLQVFRELDFLEQTIQGKWGELESDIEMLEEKIKLYPRNRILSIYWVNYKRDSINKNANAVNTALYLETIFEKYDYLVELEDFFTETYLITGDLTQVENRLEILTPILEKAVIKYPKKIALKRALAYNYFNKKLYVESLNMFQTLFSQIGNFDLFDEDGNICNSQEKNIHLFDKDGYSAFYLGNDKITMSKIYDKIGNIDKCLEYLSDVIEHLPTIEYDEGIVEPYYEPYLEAFLFRMRINLNFNNFNQVKNDYDTIERYFKYEHRAVAITVITSLNDKGVTFECDNDDTNDNEKLSRIEKFYTGEYDDVINYVKNDLITIY